MNTTKNKLIALPVFINNECRLKIPKKSSLILLIILLILAVPTGSFAQNAEDTTDGRFHYDLLSDIVEHTGQNPKEVFFNVNTGAYNNISGTAKGKHVHCDTLYEQLHLLE